MDNALIHKLLIEYDYKRQKALLEAENRKIDLYNKYPDIQKLDSEINTLSISSVKNILFVTPEKKDNELKKLKDETDKLLEKKKSLLKKYNISSDYLKPKFECSLCEDTGYISDEKTAASLCTCIKQRIFDIEYNKSNIGNIEKENFDNFDFNLYSSSVNYDLYKSNTSPKDNMKIIYDYSKKFVENFDNPEEKNIIFSGPTGLGKTFLSNCIAKELLSKGKTVLYQTAPVMLDMLTAAHFDGNEKYKSTLDNILNVDLLIIDDLGTEMMNSMKFAELFTIINTRLLNQNNKITKTIISTNLDLKSLFEVYQERIASRIVGNYNIFKFFGEDIRLKKK
ncbi:MAG: ATP-binding protein [Clostridia bacterium]|nr:ATP-binding protein [Clostridia bacterium]